MWLHLGANFGATTKDDNPITYQASDKELENMFHEDNLRSTDYHLKEMKTNYPR